MRTPVLVEWITYDYIPNRRHAIVASLGEALRWIEEGADIKMYPIDPNLFMEFVYEAKAG